MKKLLLILASVFLVSCASTPDLEANMTEFLDVIFTFEQTTDNSSLSPDENITLAEETLDEIFSSLEDIADEEKLANSSSLLIAVTSRLVDATKTSSSISDIVYEKNSDVSYSFTAKLEQYDSSFDISGTIQFNDDGKIDYFDWEAPDIVVPQ